MNRYFILLLMIWVAGCDTALAASDQDMFAAVKADNTQEIERLLATGDNVNAKNDQGLTPLFWASVWGADKAAELLVARGADVDAKNGSEGFTPLFTAVYNGHKEMAEFLIHHGAAVNARSKSGWTPLHKAIEPLAVLPATTEPPPEKITQTLNIVELLLANGADVNARTANGIMPIHNAALSKQAALVELLIAKGADINAKGQDDATPLYLAARKDSVGVAALLLRHGAEVDSKTRSGFTPLLISAEEGNPDVAQTLLEHGADVNTRDKSGLTPLLWALKSLMVKYTLQASSPAANQMRKQIARTDLEQEREALGKMKGEFSEVALLLINHGADINRGVQGDTPMRMAALVGNTALIKALIAQGADVNARVADANESPLHAAIAEGHRDIAELLINNGADTNARNMSQRTPLHFLARFIPDRKLAELLIQHGADVNAKDKDGQTPLSFATKAGNSEVAAVLQQHGGE